MEFITHPNHTLYMGAPRDWDEKRDGPCDALSIHDMRQEATPKMESAWITNGMEGHLLSMGLATLRLGVLGHQHPPMYMAVYPKSNMTRAQRGRAVQDAIRDLVDYAKLNGYSVKNTILESGRIFVEVTDKEAQR